MGTKAKHPSERFWDKVEKRSDEECWLWQGARHPTGYGFLFAGPLYPGNARFVKAHRLSWEITNGRPVPGNGCILHRCDNPPCVNPKHLYLGTRADNALDRKNRKRGKEAHQFGEANDNAKLSELDVKAVLACLAAGKSQIEVARFFVVKQPQISRIARRKSWAHLWE